MVAGREEGGGRRAGGVVKHLSRASPADKKRPSSSPAKKATPPAPRLPHGSERKARLSVGEGRHDDLERKAAKKSFADAKSQVAHGSAVGRDAEGEKERVQREEDRALRSSIDQFFRTHLRGYMQGMEQNGGQQESSRQHDELDGHKNAALKEAEEAESPSLDCKACSSSKLRGRGFDQLCGPLAEQIKELKRQHIIELRQARLSSQSDGRKGGAFAHDIEQARKEIGEHYSKKLQEYHNVVSVEESL
eukprot:600231-Hanusia_phi.AAC.3